MALVYSKPALFRPCNIQRHLVSQAFIRGDFFRVPRLAFWRSAFLQFAPVAKLAFPVLASGLTDC